MSSRSHLGPMRVQLNGQPLRTVEQQCESSSSMNISQELEKKSVTMQMKMEAMQKEIHELYAIKELQIRNGGKLIGNCLEFLCFFAFCTC